MEVTESYFNEDESWQEKALTYESLIRRIAQKYCSDDEALRDDVEQCARIEVARIRPERVNGDVEAYVRTVIRNAILSYLDSYNTGPWDKGRTRISTNPRTGEKCKVRFPARYSSLDALVSEYGMQVEEGGSLRAGDYSDDISDDGLLSDTFDMPESEAGEDTARRSARGEPRHFDPRDNETALADSLTLDLLLAQLDESEQQTIRTHLDEDRNIYGCGRGAGDYASRRIAHKLAIIAGAEWTCDACKQSLPAERFGWYNRTCVGCESPMMRHHRNRLERENGWPETGKRTLPTAKLTTSQRTEMRAMYATGAWSQAKLAAHFGISPGTVQRSVRGVTKAIQPAPTSRPPEPSRPRRPHGTHACYQRGCSCPACVRAMRRFYRERYQMRRAQEAAVA